MFARDQLFASASAADTDSATMALRSLLRGDVAMTKTRAEADIRYSIWLTGEMAVVPTPMAGVPAGAMDWARLGGVRVSH